MSNEFELVVDRDLCIGAQNCSLHAPQTFSYDEDGLVVAGDPEASSEGELRSAEENCPSGAIQLVERP